jgi:hypothetical protein
MIVILYLLGFYTIHWSKSKYYLNVDFINKYNNLLDTKKLKFSHDRYNTDTKIISFSLWGSTPCYNWGALENALAAVELFPGWTCRYYIGDGVIKDMLDKLSALPNVEIVMMTSVEGNKKTQDDTAHASPGPRHGRYTMWRFTPCFESDGVVIVRDTDSVLNPRDKAVVSDWLKSDKDFHIIRDHNSGHSSRIMGGMFGVRNGILKKFKNKFLKDYDSASPLYGQDQDWLQNIIYPYVRNNSIVHDSKPWFEDEKDIRQPFPPVKYTGFIGDILCASYPLIKKYYNITLKNLKR